MTSTSFSSRAQTATTRYQSTLVRPSATCLRAPYAMSGTDEAYGAARLLNSACKLLLLPCPDLLSERTPVYRRRLRRVVWPLSLPTLAARRSGLTWANRSLDLPAYLTPCCIPGTSRLGPTAPARPCPGLRCRGVVPGFHALYRTVSTFESVFDEPDYASLDLSTTGGCFPEDSFARDRTIDKNAVPQVSCPVLFLVTAVPFGGVVLTK